MTEPSTSVCVELYNTAQPCERFFVIRFVMSITNTVRAASLTIFALVIPGALADTTSGPDTLRAQVSLIAEHLTHFATRAIITNRPLLQTQVPPNLVTEQLQLFADLSDLSRDHAELHRLLNDPNPRVRTLALAALFVRDDAYDLPYFARLIGDHAATFADLHDSMSAAPGVRPLGELEGPQTVGQVASAMIQFYLQAGHLRLADRMNGYPIPEAELSSAFDRYWVERKGRAFCASWFLVKLERATRQTEAVPEQYRADVDKVLAQIGTLRSPDREWTLLFALFGAPGPRSEYVIRDAALVYMAKAIGPEDLMKFLLLEPFSSDPDLHFTQADMRGEVLFPISAFILNHAPQLLRPSDAAVIRAHAFGNPQHSQGSSSLWIAASDWLLGIQDSARGADQFKADFSLFPPTSMAWSQMERMPLAVDLWRLRGASEKKFLVNWFYGLSPEQNPSLGQDFLRAVDADARPDTPELFTAIVADPRFDKTNWSVLACLLESAGDGTYTPLVPTTTIYSYQPNQFRADEAAVFASWRNVLRRHYGLPEHPMPGAH